jgi:hypothetical protein
MENRLGVENIKGKRVEWFRCREYKGKEDRLRMESQ